MPRSKFIIICLHFHIYQYSIFGISRYPKLQIFFDIYLQIIFYSLFVLNNYQFVWFLGLPLEHREKIDQMNTITEGDERGVEPEMSISHWCIIKKYIFVLCLTFLWISWSLDEFSGVFKNMFFQTQGAKWYDSILGKILLSDGSAEDIKWRNQRYLLVLFEVFEHMDFFSDTMLMAKILFFGHGTWMLFLVSAVCFGLSIAGHSLRPVIFDNELDPSQHGIMLPFRCLREYRHMDNKSTAQVTAIYNSYTLLMRFVEDIPQIFISIMFTMQAGATFWGVWALIYSTLITVGTAINMCINYPFLAILLSCFRPDVLERNAPMAWRAKYAAPNMYDPKNWKMKDPYVLSSSAKKCIYWTFCRYCAGFIVVAILAYLLSYVAGAMLFMREGSSMMGVAVVIAVFDKGICAIISISFKCFVAVRSAANLI